MKVVTNEFDVIGTLLNNGSAVGGTPIWVGSVVSGKFEALPSGGMSLNFFGGGGSSVGDVRSISLRTGTSGTYIVNQSGCIVIGDALQIQSGYSFFMGYNMVTGSKNYQLAVGSGGGLISNYGIMIGDANSVRTDHAVVFGTQNTFSQDFSTSYNTAIGHLNSIVASGGSFNFLHGYGNTITTTGNDRNFVSGYANAAITGSFNYLFGQALVTGAGTHKMAVGYDNQITGNYTVAFGYKAKSSNLGQVSQASGNFANRGDAQTSVMVVRGITTDDTTPVELSLDGAGTYIQTEDNKTYHVALSLIVRDTGSKDSAGYGVITYLIERASGYATCAVLGTSPPHYPNFNDASLSNITLDPTVDTAADGHIKFVVTGASGKTLHWVGRVEVTEVG